MFHDQTIRQVRRLQTLVQTLVPSLPGKPEAELQDAHAELVGVLEELEVYVVDRKVLSRTSIGKDVGALRKHSDKKIARIADQLVGQWKKDMKLRDQVVEGFMEKGSLKRRADAQEIEDGLFNATCPLGFLEGEDYRSYQRHYKRICTHLRARGEGSLVHRLQLGEVRPDKVATLPDAELLSNGYLQQKEAFQQEGLRAVLADAGAAEAVVTEQFVCRRCQSSRCTYREVQTGWHNDHQDMSILVQCLECGERWKENDDHGLNGS